MKKTTSTFVYFIIFFLSLTPLSFGGVVYFKNGNILEGEIIKISENDITIKYNFGIVSFPKERLQAIESTTDKESLLLGGKKRLEKDELNQPPIILPYFDTQPREYKNKAVLDSSNKALSAVKLLRNKLDGIMEQKEKKLETEFTAKEEFYSKKLVDANQKIQEKEKEITHLSQELQNTTQKLEDTNIDNINLKIKIAKLNKELYELNKDKLKLIEEKKQITLNAAQQLEATVADLNKKHQTEQEELTAKFNNEKDVLEKMLSSTSTDISIAKKDKRYNQTLLRNVKDNLTQKEKALAEAFSKIDTQRKKITDLERKLYTTKTKMDKLKTEHEKEKISLLESVVTEAVQEVRKEEELDLAKKTVPSKIEAAEKTLSNRDKIELIEFLRNEVTTLENNIKNLSSQNSSLKQNNQSQEKTLSHFDTSLQEIQKKLEQQQEKNYLQEKEKEKIYIQHKKEMQNLKNELLKKAEEERAKLIKTFTQERATLKEVIDNTTELLNQADSEEKNTSLQNSKEEIIPNATETPEKNHTKTTQEAKFIGNISEIEENLGRIFLDLTTQVKNGDTFYVIRDKKKIAKVIILKIYPSFNGAIAQVIPKESITQLKETDPIGI